MKETFAKCQAQKNPGTPGDKGKQIPAKTNKLGRTANRCGRGQTQKGESSNKEKLPKNRRKKKKEKEKKARVSTNETKHAGENEKKRSAREQHGVKAISAARGKGKKKLGRGAGAQKEIIGNRKRAEPKGRNSEDNRAEGRDFHEPTEGGNPIRIPPFDYYRG